MNKHFKKKKLIKTRWLGNAAAICIGIAFYFILTDFSSVKNTLSSFLSVISSIIIGIVLAYLLNPIVNFMEQKVFFKLKNESIKHLLSIVVVFMALVIFLVILIITLVPPIASNVNTISENLTQYFLNSDETVSSLESFFDSYGIDFSLIRNSVQNIFNNIQEDVPKYIQAIAQYSASVATGLLNCFIGFIFAVYFLLEKKLIVVGIDNLRRTVYTDATYEKWTRFWKKCNGILVKYVWYSLLEALIVGMINALFMLIMKMPYVLLISLIVGITNLLPTFGPIIGAVISCIILIIYSPVSALEFLIFTVVLQTIDGYVLKPKMFSGSLGVPSFMILIAVIIFGRIFGILGILLAIPITAILSYIYKDIIFPKLRNRKFKLQQKLLAESADTSDTRKN